MSIGLGARDGEARERFELVFGDPSLAPARRFLDAIAIPLRLVPGAALPRWESTDPRRPWAASTLTVGCAVDLSAARCAIVQAAGRIADGLLPRSFRDAILQRLGIDTAVADRTSKAAAARAELETEALASAVLSSWRSDGVLARDIFDAAAARAANIAASGAQALRQAAQALRSPSGAADTLARLDEADAVAAAVDRGAWRKESEGFAVGARAHAAAVELRVTVDVAEQLAHAVGQDAAETLWLACVQVERAVAAGRGAVPAAAGEIAEALRIVQNEPHLIAVAERAAAILWHRRADGPPGPAQRATSALRLFMATRGRPTRLPLAIDQAAAPVLRQALATLPPTRPRLLPPEVEHGLQRVAEAIQSLRCGLVSEDGLHGLVDTSAILMARLRETDRLGGEAAAAARRGAAEGLGEALKGRGTELARDLPAADAKEILDLIKPLAAEDARLHPLTHLLAALERATMPPRSHGLSR